MKMTTQEAVELAMYLAVKAPTKKDSFRCIEIAEQLASQLTADEVVIARKNVGKKLASE